MTLYIVTAAIAAVALVAAGHLDLVIHISPPFASCSIAKIDILAGTIEFDLSISGQIDAQHFSDRQIVLRDPARAVSWIEKKSSASSCVQDSPSEEL